VAELSEKSKLSKPTTMKLLTSYVDHGLVINVGKGNSTTEGGKPPTLFRFNERAGFILVFHMFPDELYSAVTDLNSNIQRERSAPLSEMEGSPGIVDKMAALYRDQLEALALPTSKLIGVAVGAHGITDSAHGVIITSPHFPRWGENLPLRQLFRDKTGYNGPILVDNQIRFQAYAEKVKGVARNRRNIIALEAGIGLVAGIIDRDEIKRGVHFLAGEIGHMVLNPCDEELCACGGRGCFETMVSTKRIMRRVLERARRFPDSTLFKNRRPEQLSVEDVFLESNRGDALAREVMDETARWFAIGLWNLVLAHDPEIIVIQGIFTKAGDSFLERVRLLMTEVSCPKVQRKVEIVYSQFGKEIGVIGASALVVNDYLAKRLVALGIA
jgi:predicted NBD/HSP70 family sugar kinase